MKRPRVSRAQSAAVCGPGVLPVLTLFSAADVRGFALPEASVEGLGVGGGSSLIEPSAVVVQVGSVAAALVVAPMHAMVVLLMRAAGQRRCGRCRKEGAGAQNQEVRHDSSAGGSCIVLQARALVAMLVVFCRP